MAGRLIVAVHLSASGGINRRSGILPFLCFRPLDLTLRYFPCKNVEKATIPALMFCQPRARDEISKLNSRVLLAVGVFNLQYFARALLKQAIHLKLLTLFRKVSVLNNNGVGMFGENVLQECPDRPRIILRRISNAG